MEKKPEIQYQKGILHVGPTPYKKKVTAPKPTELLKYTPEELDILLKLPSAKGPQIQKGDSYYTAYCVDADNAQTVRDVYFKVRLLHARARHIICAYKLPGPETDKFLNEDFCDDDEFGAGALLLGVMKKNNISCKALFVVRHCGKQKLGREQLSAYIVAAKALLTLKPKNNILGIEQSIEWQDREDGKFLTKFTAQHQQMKKQPTGKDSKATYTKLKNSRGGSNPRGRGGPSPSTRGRQTRPNDLRNYGITVEKQDSHNSYTRVAREGANLNSDLD